LTLPKVIVRGLRISAWEGVVATVHGALTFGIFSTAYLAILGANAFQFAVLNGLPSLADITQPVASYIIMRYQNRKVFTIVMAAISRLIYFVPIAFLWMANPHSKIWAFIAISVISRITMSMNANSWVSWMAALMPDRVRGSYLGMRNMLASVTNLVTLTIFSAVMDNFRSVERAYVVLFAFASAVSIASTVMLILQPAHRQRRRADGPVTFASVLSPLKDPVFRGFFRSMFIFNFGCALGSPFFAVYMFKNLSLSYSLINVFTIVSSVLAIIVQPLWGTMMDRIGNKRVLILGVSGIFWMPYLYIIAQGRFVAPLYLDAALSGIFWPAVGLAVMNLIITEAPDNEVSSYIGLYSALTGALMFVTALLSGSVAHSLAFMHWRLGPLIIVNLHVIFFFAATFRLIGLLALVRVPEVRAEQLPHRPTSYARREMLRILLGSKLTGFLYRDVKGM
jgi:MFS family permease